MSQTLFPITSSYHCQNNIVCYRYEMLIRISSEDCLLQNWHFFKYLITFRMWWFNGWKMLMKDYFKILFKKWNVFNISKYQAVIIWNIWKSWNKRNNLWFETVNLRQYKSGFKKRGEFRNTLECIKVKKIPQFTTNIFSLELEVQFMFVIYLHM